MKTLFCIWLAFVGMVSAGMAQSPADLRKERDDLTQRGLWKEALAFYQEKLAGVSDEGSGNDLSKAVQALSRMNQWEDFDELVESAITVHEENAGVAQAAAEAYRGAPTAGVVAGGRFQRGWKVRGGKYVDTSHRDRVRSIQLLLRSIETAGEGSLKVRSWRILADVLQSRQAWMLQLLTPLEALPEWEDNGPQGGTEGIPWIADGPLLFGVPESWEAAENDGERWRFALEQLAKSGPAEAAEAKLIRARISEQWFGTGTLQSYGWWKERDPESAEGLLAVDTLADDEVLAKTSDGVRRFKLPADWHFIALYRSLVDEAPVGEDAGFALAQVYLGRRQYVKARESLEQLIAKYGPGAEDFRRKLLEQITGNWGKFDVARTVAKGSRVQLPLIFRNATNVTFTAAPVDMDAVLGDMMDYLKSNPLEIEWQAANPSAIASRIIAEKQSKYVGEVKQRWEKDLAPADGYRPSRMDVEMPVDEAGAWWVAAKMKDGNEFYTLVWIVDQVLAQRDVAGDKQWWVADAADGAPLAGVEIEFFGYETVNRERKNPQDRRMDVVTSSFQRTTDEDGRTWVRDGDGEGRKQWIAIARKEGRSTAFFGFQPFAISRPAFDNGNRDIGYGITDRPLYQPGDELNVKFFLRNVGYFEPDEAKYANRTGVLTVFNGRGEEAVKVPELRTDELGALETKVILPKDAPLGRWRAVFSIPEVFSSTVSFQVEEFRKPEYEVTVEAPADPVVLGGTFEVSVKAAYFHGAPVREAEVEVTVKQAAMGERWFPAGHWDWLYGKGTWWPGNEAEWHPGWESWGCLPPPPPWRERRRWIPDEVVLRRSVPLGSDGTVKVEVDTATALETHGDLDMRYTIEARVVDASRREERGNGSVIAARKPFEVVVWTDRGFTRPGEEVEAKVSASTLAGKPVAEAEGTLKLFRLTVDGEGKVNEAEAGSWPVKTDAGGNFVQRFPAPEAGQYRLAAELSRNGDSSAGAFIVNVHGPGRAEENEWKFGNLELVTDRLEYAAGDVMKLRVNSDRADANVWLFLHMGGSSGRESKRIRLDGKSLEVDVPLDRRDMPNMFVEAVAIYDAAIFTATREVLLPPESKMIDLVVEPADRKLGPRGKSNVKVILKDPEGNPVTGKVTITVYDKALEAITGGSNVPPIREGFWSWKNRYYGSRSACSVPYASGSLSREDEAWMEELSVGEGASFAEAQGMGGKMMRASADASVDPFGAPMPAAAPAPVTETAGTPAQDAPEIQVRGEFADLLKWSGQVEADAQGVAEIPLEFPDNLTTWIARAWVLGSGTRVGEGRAEVVVSKDLLVRLQAPRFLVERDETVISAVVHNDHAEAKEVRVSLELEGGAVAAVDGKPSTVSIPSKGVARVDWKLKADAEGIAKIRMKAETEGDGDAVERDLPVRVHGMRRQDAWSRVISPEEESAKISIEVPDRMKPDETRLAVRISPSAALAVVDAIPYLSSYPHGCTEQTLNRFLPAVIARKMLADLKVDLAEIRNKRINLNPQELGDPKVRAAQWSQWRNNPVFDSREMDRMIAAGLERLAGMQNQDGGWGWFSGYGEQSYPHTTAVVMHGLQAGRDAGLAVDEVMFNRGKDWLASYEKEQVQALRRHAERQEAIKEGKETKPVSAPEKARADALDALVREILGRGGVDHPEMLEALYANRVELPLYAQVLVGLETNRLKDQAKLEEILRLTGQMLKRDEENQTAFLDAGSSGHWWNWYGSDVEANAWYLKLLTAVKPNDADTRGLAKFLVNGRKGGSYWRSTRDTAYAVEALAGYVGASGEGEVEMEVEVLMNGKSLRKVKIDRDNLFSFNGALHLRGKEVASGKHEIEIRKSGKGTVYANAYLEVFSLEDRLRAAGLEVKISRKVSRVTEADEEGTTVDQSGAAVSHQRERIKREPLGDGAVLKSGDRIEVELTIESKNDYEYLILSDIKAAGFEALDALSGYVRDGSLSAYMEPRNQSVDFFLRSLPRGKHVLRYLLRAESPGVYKALPSVAEAMYAPELKANSDDFRLKVSD